MDSITYLNILYDYYGTLLTEKQKDYFEDYYFSNLSLSEIAENYNVSRNAVHKQLKDIEKKLAYYEDKLKLYKRSLEIKQIINNLDTDIKEKLEKLI